jgi:hypothetical protein
MMQIMEVVGWSRGQLQENLASRVPGDSGGFMAFARRAHHPLILAPINEYVTRLALRKVGVGPFNTVSNNDLHLGPKSLLRAVQILEPSRFLQFNLRQSLDLNRVLSLLTLILR